MPSTLPFCIGFVVLLCSLALLDEAYRFFLWTRRSLLPYADSHLARFGVLPADAELEWLAMADPPANYGLIANSAALAERMATISSWVASAARRRLLKVWVDPKRTSAQKSPTPITFHM